MEEKLLLQILDTVKKIEKSNEEIKNDTNNAINGLREEVNSEIRRLEEKMDTKFDELNKRITNEMFDTAQMVKILFAQTDKITNYLGLTWE